MVAPGRESQVLQLPAGARILVVDDDRYFSEALAAQLVNVGMVVDTARTAEETQARLAESTYDLLLVDGLLPDKPGVDVIEDLRTRDYGGQIVFLSAFFRDMPTYHRLTSQLGVADVWHKPIEPAEVVRRLGIAVASGAAPAPTPELDGLMDQLRDEYAEQLPLEAEKLAEAIARVEIRPDDAEAVDHAIRVAHTLYGTSGSYGYKEVSALVGQAETMLRGFRDQQEIDWSALQSVLHVLAALSEGRLDANAVGLSTREPAVPEPGDSALQEKEYARNGGGLWRSTIVLFDPQKKLGPACAEYARQQQVRLLASTDEEEIMRWIGGLPVDGVLLHDVEEASTRVHRLIRRMSGYGERVKIPYALVADSPTIRGRIAAHQSGASLLLQNPISLHDFSQGIQVLKQGLSAEAPRVFVMDDDQGFVRYMDEALTDAGFQIETCYKPSEAFDRIEAFDPDLLLVDLRMPGMSGVDVSRALRTMPRWYDLPIVLVSASTDREARLTAAEAGVDDFVEKPFDPSEMIARIRFRIKRHRLLRQRVDRDPLTGVLQRRAFIDAASSRLALARMEKTDLAFAVLDLDHFKRINDELGHKCGDLVLSSVGSLLNHTLPRERVRGRWGGEEFAVLFHDVPYEQVERELRHVLDELRQTRFEIESKDGVHQDLRVTFSAGIARFGEDGASLEDLFVAADRRLYAAKNRGRNAIASRN